MDTSVIYGLPLGSNEETIGDNESLKFDFKDILCIDDAAIIYDCKGIL